MAVTRASASRERSPAFGQSGGARPRAPRDTRYKWSYIFGAACPARGTAAGLILPYANAEAMGLHLDEIAKAVAPGTHALLILDGAEWHGTKALKVPDNISLLKLPAYAPELNSIENVWAYLTPRKQARNHSVRYL